MSYCAGYFPPFDYDDQGGPYMGFAVAAAVPAAAATGPLAPFVLGFAALASVLPSLHIGAGRKEADAIVPEQEKLGAALHELDEIIRTNTLTASDIKQLYNQLSTMWQQYQAFIYSSTFTADGDTRASDQSKATMEPMVQGRLDNLMRMLNAVLGLPQVPTAIQSGQGFPSLEFRTTSDLALPQAGFFQPGAVQPAGAQMIGPAPGLNNDLLMKLGVAAAVVFVLSRR